MGGFGWQNRSLKKQIPEACSGDRKSRQQVSAAALRALGEGADQLVLHAVADLAARFPATGFEDGPQRLAEIVLALGHFSLHIHDGGLLPPSPSI